MTGGNEVKFDVDELLRKGIFVQRMTSPKRLMQLIQALCPQKTSHRLIRVGAPSDGGYLVPDDLNGIAACFSPGVDTIASFEMDLLQRFGIGSHLADYSVEGPPGNFAPLSFVKKFVGPSSSEKYIHFDAWMEQQPGFGSREDFILQMDIEGAEYATLLSAKPRNLARFRIMVIEFHNLLNWGDPAFFGVVIATFRKLLRDFMVVHNHPNNCSEMKNMGGLIVPQVCELTFLRRDRSISLGPCDTFPHPLDCANTPSRPDVVLPKVWYSV